MSDSLTSNPDLIRYGIKWTPMEDGYWTPWHLAQANNDNLQNAVTAMRTTRNDMQRRLIAQDNEIEQLRVTLEEGRLLVEKLRVFGNDNVHKHDVAPWLENASALLRGAHKTQGELEQLRRIDKAARMYVENRTHGNYSKMCDALFSAIPPTASDGE